MTEILLAEKLRRIVSNREHMLEGANACTAALAKSKGLPHKPIQPHQREFIAAYWAAIPTVIAGIGIISLTEGTDNIEDQGMDLLGDTAEGNLDTSEMEIMLRIFGAAGASCAPFIQYKEGPLAVVEELTVFELVKDETKRFTPVIQAAATFLLEKLKAT